MKLYNYILSGVCLISLASCNDYLDIDAPSKHPADQVFVSTGEIQTALNGVYTCALSDNTFGNALYNALLLNSDVDFTANSQENGLGSAPRRFDTSTDNGTVSKVWNALYTGVETANEFIYNLENSEIYATGDDELYQMMGEAKVLRAMFYDEIVNYWGDIPFSLQSTYETQEFILPVTSRDEVRMQLIEDLEKIAPKMKFAANLDYGVEQISKEACWAMIARLALNAGGYSLRPGSSSTSYGQMERPSNYKEFYQICRQYADSVIESGTHSLKNSFQQVFVNECNFRVVNDDDPIFEIPFAKQSTGQWGYIQGPGASSDSGETSHIYGACSGSVGVSDFYRYSFDEKDLRREFINGMWSYTAYGRPAIRANYTQYNNKWSKLWNETGLGAKTTGATGINFAYLRYADVLLMFAEAENELNGPTAAALNAVKEVRDRAFAAADQSEKVNTYLAAAAGDKETFLKAILDERKWEFAGENMRWKDLVRNNLYAENIFYSFLRYYSVAENAGGSSQYIDMVEAYDNKDDYYQTIMPSTMYYCYIKNPNDKSYFQNTELACLYIANPYKAALTPVLGPANYFANEGITYEVTNQRAIDGLESSSTSEEWQSQDFYAWWNESEGCPNAYCLYSFYGYIRGVEGSSTIQVVHDGQAETIDPLSVDVSTLPAVRYILPYPAEAITRSEGAYSQQYGYK